MDQRSDQIPEHPKKGKGNQSTITWHGDRPIGISQALLRDGRIPALCVRLYGILASYCTSDNPLPFPSVETLRENCGMGKKAVERALKELETWGLLVRYQPRCEAGTFASNRYKILPYTLNRRPKSDLRSKRRSPWVQNRPTSNKKYTSEEKELVRTTPLPHNPSIPKPEYHHSHCNCHQCRQERNPVEF